MEYLRPGRGSQGIASHLASQLSPPCIPAPGSPTPNRLTPVAGPTVDFLTSQCFLLDSTRLTPILCLLQNSVKHHLLQEAFPGPCGFWHCPSHPGHNSLRAFITCPVGSELCEGQSHVGAQSLGLGLRDSGLNPGLQLSRCHSQDKLSNLAEFHHLQSGANNNTCFPQSL